MGDVGAGETLSIDREFVSLAGVERPNLLFIPTASEDSEDYVRSIEATYQDRLGCRVDVLRLYSEDRDWAQISTKIEAADLIYVGGGNTKAMLEKWRQVGLDREYWMSVIDGKPVGGLSAGAICWFSVGNSDWPQYENMPNVLTARLDCLGLVDLVLCPHTKNEAFRLGQFREMMLHESSVGLGLDDCCAIQVRGDEYRLLGSQPDVKGHLMFRKGKDIVHEILEVHDDFRPLSELENRILG